MSTITNRELDEILSNADENDVNTRLLFTSMKDGAVIHKQPDIILENPSRYIVNSVFFDFQHDIVDASSPISSTMPSFDIFEEKVKNLGICNDDLVVVYDDFGNFCASRVWFMFKTAGFNNIKVLSGGLPKWLSEGRKTTTKLKTPSKVGNFKVNSTDAYKFVDKSFVLELVNSEHATFSLFDARSLSRYLGKEKESRPHLRSGHIPTAKSLHYQTLQNELGEFILENETPSTLMNTDAGAVFSCGSGVTACILAQYADMLKISPLYVYDGSWSEWGADIDLPIETQLEN